MQSSYIKENFFVATSVLYGCDYLCYCEKVRRMMRTAIVSYLLNAESSGTNFKFQKCPFSFWDQLLGPTQFVLFSGPFWTVGKFIPSLSEVEKLAGLDKKKLFINLVSRVTSLDIRIKYRLKIRVTGASEVEILAGLDQKNC